MRLSGRTLDGDTFDLATLRGRPVVINVWGSWCAPCRKEAPELQKASVELGRRGVVSLGIDTRDDTASARAFVRQYQIGYPSLVDDGTLLLALQGAVPASAVPTTVILDRKGRAAARILGATTAATISGLVEDLAEDSTPPPS
jgi:thiol-disulfide isomerase/thioredoxin